jgi:putative zinc finger/helix-turn-helix YgiT family protein
MEAATKRPNDHGPFELECPNDHGPMKRIKENETVTYRGKEFVVETEGYECPTCKIKAATIKQSAKTQKAISDAYKSAEGLLTSDEIRNYRIQLDLTQQALADKISVGVASIKRWEKGLIQSKSMDQALRGALQCQTFENNYTGNREFSIPRIRLVLSYLESRTGKQLLKKDDKMLFASKYLWYADMVAYRDLGKCMTGATYARLPYGPQLNNYRDLIDDIKSANMAEAEPLSIEEKRILDNIAKAFPEEHMAYDAAHRELIWQRKTNGKVIPYSEATELKEI